VQLVSVGSPLTVQSTGFAPWRVANLEVSNALDVLFISRAVAVIPRSLAY